MPIFNRVLPMKNMSQIVSNLACVALKLDK
nr:MAG TPA: hypothetical protein [Crassvirales sp.]